MGIFCGQSRFYAKSNDDERFHERRDDERNAEASYVNVHVRCFGSRGISDNYRPVSKNS